MNRDYPLAPTDFGDKEKRIKRLEKREEKLVSKGNKAVDEGRDKKADRIFKRAANVEDRKIRLSK
jgi:hypothetical protein